MAERLAFPLTLLYKQEGDLWAALACEVDVASCGDSLDEARAMLREAVELYLTEMLASGQRTQIERPVPPEALAEFIGEDRENARIERVTAILWTEPGEREYRTEFVPSLTTPVDYCGHVLATG